MSARDNAPASARHRPSDSGDTREPSPGMSRSKNVRVNERIQRVHAAADGASHARGKPPRNHSLSWLAGPTSASEKPPTSTKRILPARVSDTPWIKSHEALPKSRKTAFRSGSSQIGRSTSKSDGIRWISSITTSPSLVPRILSGVAESASCVAATSRSKKVDGPGHSSATWRASVVLPTCRAPSKATAGTSESPWTAAFMSAGRAIYCCISFV